MGASRRQIIAALMLALTLVLAACGGDGETEAVAADLAEEASEPEDSFDDAVVDETPEEPVAEAEEVPPITEPVDGIPIEDREADIAPAGERLINFIVANRDVCPTEVTSFNVIYPTNPNDPLVAQLDAGIEDRGNALVACLTDAGEVELSEDVALLTRWGRFLAIQRS